MAGSIARSMNGSRCILVLDGKTVGVAQSVGLSIGYQVDPIFTIGRYETAELVPNSQQPVTITMRMVRIIGASTGPLGNLRMPTLDDVSPLGLLNNTDFTVLLIDRQNGGAAIPTATVGTGTSAATAATPAAFAQIQKCRTTGWTFDSTASQTSEMTLTFTGIFIGDESVNVNDNKDASEAPFDVV